MLKLALLLVALAATASAVGLVINTHIDSHNIERIQKIFRAGLVSPDLQTAYYSVLNYNSQPIVEKNVACVHITALHRDSKLNDFEKHFYLMASYKLLQCPTPLDEAVQNAVVSRKEFNTAQEMFYTYFSVRSLSTRPSDAEKAALAKNLLAIVRKDDSLTSLGYAFAVAAELGAPAAAIADWLEGAIAQADEIDGKQLQFEGGLSVTALVLNGAFKLATALNKPAVLTAEQTLKFTTYLLSRRSVTTAKGASVLLEVLATITRQPDLAPICIQLFGFGQLSAGADAKLTVKIVDVLGGAVRPAITAVTATVKQAGNATPVIAKTPLVVRSSDASVFTMPLSTLTRGAYTVHVQTDGLAQTLPIRVLGRVRVALLEIGVGDADSTSAIRKQPVKFQDMLTSELLVDMSQKIQLRAQLVDEVTGEPITVHQAFVRIEHRFKRQEILYVAELDAQRAYKFELDLGARASDFGHLSGEYSLEFIVGDASLSNSFRWTVADMQFRFAAEAPSTEDEEENSDRAPRPEIKHLFRVPEPRPARFVSDLFTALCVAPLLVLVVLWSKLGVNVSNFPCSLSAVGFHSGFGAILTLFGVFFWRLNMFETIRYLVPLALVTFFFGNRLLRSIAAGGKA